MPWAGSAGTPAEQGSDCLVALRCRLARDKPSAAQVAATAPLAGMSCQSIRQNALSSSASGATGAKADPQQVGKFFLDFDDCLGAFKTTPQQGILPFRNSQFCRQWIGRARFRSTPRGHQRAKCPRVTLSAPLAQGRRVKPVAAKDRTNLAGAGCLVSLLQDTQFVRCGERASTRPVRNFGVGCCGCRHDSRPSASFCADTHSSPLEGLTA